MKYRIHAEVKALDDVAPSRVRWDPELYRYALRDAKAVCDVLNRHAFAEPVDARNADEAELVAAGAYVLAGRRCRGIGLLLSRGKLTGSLVFLMKFYLNLVKISVSACDGGARTPGDRGGGLQ